MFSRQQKNRTKHFHQRGGDLELAPWAREEVSPQGVEVQAGPEQLARVWQGWT